jgi:hypothetical protein
MFDPLTGFGLFAVTAMLVAYALEHRSHWFVLAFAASCALGSIYGFLQGAWPFGVVEAVCAGAVVSGYVPLSREASDGSHHQHGDLHHGRHRRQLRGGS